VEFCSACYTGGALHDPGVSDTCTHAVPTAQPERASSHRHSQALGNACAGFYTGANGNTYRHSHSDPQKGEEG
jgi:hypothetical protein